MGNRTNAKEKQMLGMFVSTIPMKASIEVQSSFTEHIQSELEYENSKRFQKDKAYWNAQYEAIPEPVSLKASDTYQIQLDAARFSKEISPDLYKKMARRPLPLYDSPLFKFAVVRISEEESWFFAKVHHIISDGISMTILGNRITDIYLKLAKGETDLEPVLGIDSGLLTEAIRKFVRTNDTMRFRLMFEGEDEPKQYIAEDEPFQIEYFDASESGGADGVLKWGQAGSQNRNIALRLGCSHRHT
ncbi:hypothetical protein DT075_38450 [Bacillus licheniformis]|nr:hypothetical protein DT075_38450 [Bacillus licheniformis]